MPLPSFIFQTMTTQGNTIGVEPGELLFQFLCGQKFIFGSQLPENKKFNINRLPVVIITPQT